MQVVATNLVGLGMTMGQFGTLMNGTSAYPNIQAQGNASYQQVIYQII